MREQKKARMRGAGRGACGQWGGDVREQKKARMRGAGRGAFTRKPSRQLCSATECDEVDHHHPWLRVSDSQSWNAFTRFFRLCYPRSGPESPGWLSWPSLSQEKVMLQCLRSWLRPMCRGRGAEVQPRRGSPVGPGLNWAKVEGEKTFSSPLLNLASLYNGAMKTHSTILI